jgi:hypothetical protein
MPEEDGGAAADAACCGPADYDAVLETVLPDQVRCGAWGLSNNANTELPTLAADKVHIETSSAGESMYFVHRETNLAIPDQLTIEARLQLVSGTSSTASRGPATVMWVYGANHSKNALQISASEIFLLSSENVKGPAYAMNTTSAMHDYRIVVDTELNTIAVTVDGQPALTGTNYPDPNNAAPTILWGEASMFTHGASDWERVSHNAYVCPVAQAD